jgi:iron-sulfur cluster repair protein YtfE (RIC family)
MTRITDPLRAEHAGLLPPIEKLRTLADRIDEFDTAPLLAEVDRALAFVEGELVPHALAEEAVLYPAVALFLGGPDSTATMARDHVEIDRLVASLRRARDEVAAGEGGARHDVRRLLYALHAVTTLHLAKEEEVYLPILDDRLDSVVAVGIFARMHEAARSFRVRAAS